MTEPDADVPTPSDGSAASREAPPPGRPRVVRRRDAEEMTAEERAFLARHRADMPPHHDSAWG